MRNYARTVVPNLLSVRSIVTVFRTNFCGLNFLSGEAHDFWEFLYVEEGQHSVLVDGKLFELSQGEWILYPPNAYHIAPVPSTARVGIVSFEAEAKAMNFLGNRQIALTKKQQDLLSEILSMGERLFCGTNNRRGLSGMFLRANASPYELQSLKNQLEILLLDLYVNLEEEPEHDHLLVTNQENYRKEQFTSLTQYLQEHLADNLSVEDIAKGCSLSKTTLRELCREYCGCGPMNYFLALKITEAKRLIRESSLNFTQISESLGFSTIHYFSRLFKEKTGMTPTDYAEMIQRV